MTNEELALLIKEGKTEYCLQLWHQVEKLLYKYLHFYKLKYQSRFDACGLTDEDIMQELYFAVLDTVRAFDSGKGYKFNTYLKYYVKKCIYTLLGFIKKRDALDNCVSLDNSLSDDSEETFLDCIIDENAENAFIDAENGIYNLELRKILDNEIKSNLTPIEAKRIKEYYFNNKTLRKIANEECCSFIAINNSINNGIKKLQSSSDTIRKYCDFDLYAGNGLTAYKNRGCSTVEMFAEIQ